MLLVEGEAVAEMVVGIDWGLGVVSGIGLILGEGETVKKVFLGSLFCKLVGEGEGEGEGMGPGDST